LEKDPKSQKSSCLPQSWTTSVKIGIRWDS